MGHGRTIDAAFMNSLCRRIAVGFVTCLSVLILNGAADAQVILPTCTNCGCVAREHPITRSGSATVNWDVDDQHDFTRRLITENINDQEAWFLDRWRTLFMPKLMLITEHLAGLMMYQAMILGTFLDGEQELEQQRAMQELTAEASRDYQPNVGMCIIGTGIRSLATAERRGDFTRYVLSQRSQDRQLGHRNAQGADGMHYDLQSRMALFKTRYCDIHHDSGQLLNICGASAPLNTRSADINYTQVVDQPQTIAVDFADAGMPGGWPSQDEQNIFSLADNLYATNLLVRLPEAGFGFQQNREALLDLRALVAKRSVAENSFYSILAMKTPGSYVAQPPANGIPSITSIDTRAYMTILLRQLGLDDVEARQLTGAAPSYYAQMNILTKLIYQRPDFYADLYDTKANVERKGVALQAIKLMQNFDRWDSMLRQESMLSLWLELDLKKYQDRVQDDVAGAKPGGRQVRP